MKVTNPLRHGRSPKTTPAAEPEAPRKVVAFDFDGTLTDRDSFLAFLDFAKGRAGMARAFLTQPSLLAHYLATKDRGALKSRLLYKLLGPISQEDLEILIKAFSTTTAMDLFRMDALDAWDRHNLPDRTRVIVTASPQLLVAPFGRMIGADRVIGTKLGFDAQGRLTPELDGKNCRGEEKMCRLREIFGDALDLEAAYGDTAGDREMLAAARHGHYRVFKG
ncbi:HAD-IB family hydrolase [Asticcacaulis solisilvae]|uniref:HAD-IB family hydrolase n=1 Tax=Asticcacaulis solisilvae TaxID=1217274 RepID=UPI003FD8EC3B